MGSAGVKSASGCVGGYDGVFDMSGGVAEWVDSCNGAKGMTDACHIRGGSYSATSEQLRCDWQSASARNTSSNFIGFRCCASLEE
jgi:formylglycine-generating enzyme required for sulfatase activity